MCCCAGSIPGHSSDFTCLFSLHVAHKNTYILHTPTMHHSDITSTPNTSNCSKAGVNQQSSPSTSVRNDTSTHATSSSSVASPSDVTTTKRRYDAVSANSVTPASSAKRPVRVQNVYGTGPPRGTMPQVSILRNGTNPAVSNKQKNTVPSSVRALQFVDTEKEKEKEKQFDAFYPKQGTYEADLMKEILNAHQKTDEYLIWDPRGWEMPTMIGDDTVDTMPKTFCPHCRCPPDKCHVKTFGRHCQLHVVYALYDQDFDLMMTEAHAEEVYTEKYNDALSFKITEETGQLDVKLNGYPLPKCVRRDSLTESMDYVRWYTYHCRMHRAIVVGRGKPQQGQNRLFEITK
jgi:hypothetical protein